MNRIDSLNIKIADRDIEFIDRELYARLIKHKIIQSLLTSGQESTGIADYLKRNGITVFPYDFKNKYSTNQVNAVFDPSCQLFYIQDGALKIYMRRGYTNKFRVQRYYRNLRMEQDPLSPHRYLTDQFHPKENDVILDIGSAEGFFALPYLAKVRKVYLFECSKQWQEALRYTYRGYEDKVVIVPKMVSNCDDDHHVSLDRFIATENLSDQSLFLKIDAEGSEPLILDGAKQYLAKHPPLQLAICSYHAANHENLFREIFANWNIETSDGYMLYYYDYHFKAPYLRRGVLRISS